MVSPLTTFIKRFVDVENTLLITGPECYVLGEKKELMKIGNEDSKVIVYKIRTWNVDDFYKLWHLNAQECPLTILIGSKMIKKGNKYVMVCSKLFGMYFKLNEIGIIKVSY